MKRFNFSAINLFCLLNHEHGVGSKYIISNSLQNMEEIKIWRGKESVEGLPFHFTNKNIVINRKNIFLEKITNVVNFCKIQQKMIFKKIC